MNASAIPHAIMSAHTRRSGSASSTGPTASSAHALLATASPSSTPAHVGRPRSAASTAPADSAAPSSSSGWPMSSARSVIGLHAHSATTIATVPRPAPRASRRRGEHDAERGARQQAGHGDGAEHRHLSPAQPVRGERERRAHDQRAAVGRAQLEEAARRRRGRARRTRARPRPRSRSRRSRAGPARRATRRRAARAATHGSSWRNRRAMPTPSACRAGSLTTRARTRRALVPGGVLRVTS